MKEVNSHDNSRSQHNKLQKKSNISKTNTATHSKTLPHGLSGMSWENLFVESVLDRTLVPVGTVFGAYWGALGTMSASVGTTNTIRNQYQFEAVC